MINFKKLITKQNTYHYYLLYIYHEKFFFLNYVFNLFYFNNKNFKFFKRFSFLYLTLYIYLCVCAFVTSSLRKNTYQLRKTIKIDLV